MLLSDLTAYQTLVFTNMISRGVSEDSALKVIEANILKLDSYEGRDFTPEAAVNALLLESRQREEWTVHHFARMRATILTIIDDGDPDDLLRAREWSLFGDEEEANSARLRFCDLVEAEIVNQFAIGDGS